MVIVLIYSLLINTLTFVLMGSDKRRAKEGRWRISEQTLILLAVLGGALGGVAGMVLFRHKTLKPLFCIGFPALAAVDFALFLFLLIRLVRFGSIF